MKTEIHEEKNLSRGALTRYRGSLQQYFSGPMSGGVTSTGGEWMKAEDVDALLTDREAAHAQAITALQQKIHDMGQSTDRDELLDRLEAQDAQIAALHAQVEAAEAQLRTVQAEHETTPYGKMRRGMTLRAEKAEQQLRTVAQQIREIPRHKDGTVPVHDGLKRNLPECDVCTVVRAEDLDAILRTLEGQ